MNLQVFLRTLTTSRWLALFPASLYSLGCVFSASAQSDTISDSVSKSNQNWKVLYSEGSQNKYGNEPLKVGAELKPGLNLQTGADGKVKVISKMGAFIALDSKSTIRLLDGSNDLKTAEVLEGKSRWIFQKKKSTQQQPLKDETLGAVRFKVSTSNAVMGIRGTEFMVVRNSTLGETEIVCFDGSVQFSNAANKANAFEVASGQWGGIGGRFGTAIAHPLQLPAPVVENFLKSMSFGNSKIKDPDASASGNWQ